MSIEPFDRTHLITRREFCGVAATAAASLAFGGACKQIGGSLLPNDGRLTARPRTDVKTTASGEIQLGLDRERDATLRIPKNVSQSPLPLFVMLHGATQTSEDMFWYLGNTPEQAGVVVLAPNARDTTWDAIHGGGFGPDIEFVNRALERTFETVSINPQHIAIGGFSDGASYGLSLGLINGDLFSSVIAFSPGFVIDGIPNSKPRIFISHGTNDHILPIDRCGRRIASDLKESGYDVTFREFEGDHEIPADVALEGLRFV